MSHPDKTSLHRPALWMSPRFVSPSSWLAGAALFALSVGMVGCGNSCEDNPEACTIDEDTPTLPPTGPCASDEFLNNVPTTWAMVRHLDQEVYVYSSPATVEGWYPQYTDSYFLVTLSNKGDGTYDFTEDLCAVSVSNIEITMPSGGTTIQSTEFPKDPGSWASSATWKLSLTGDASGGSACSISAALTSDLSTGEVYSGWGATFTDYLAQSCPTSTSDSRWRDEDGDAKNGFTTTTIIDGDPFVDTYICQRLLLGHEPSAVSTNEGGDYVITGAFSSLTNDQSLFGDNSVIFPNSDPEVRFEPDQYAASYYYLVELPAGASCSDVVSKLAAN